MTECPKCHLPKEEDAWQCDGCGYEFSKDYEGVRSRLQAQLRSSRITVWVALLVGLGIAGVVVYLAMRGFIYASVPLALGVFASIGAAVHRVSVLREHLSSLDRRNVPLPKATARHDAST